MISDIEQLLSITDPLTLKALSTCVAELKSNMRYYDAMVLQRKVVAGTKDRYGPKSHETGLALKTYAELLYETNDVANAKIAAEEAKAILGTIGELEWIVRTHDQANQVVPGAHGTAR